MAANGCGQGDSGRNLIKVEKIDPVAAVVVSRVIMFMTMSAAVVVAMTMFARLVGRLQWRARKRISPAAHTPDHSSASVQIAGAAGKCTT